MPLALTKGLNNYGSIPLVTLVLGSHPRPGAPNGVKVFTFEWAGQFSTVLGIQQIDGIKSQLGGYTSLNQDG
jgi:hypothetical protein